MCNGNGSSFDMRWLNHAGMVRENSGNNISGVNVSTFVDNHDTGKEHDKWVSKDWKMGYAYILTHEGRPCLFYPHFFGVRQYDNNDPSLYTQAPAGLKDDIKKLIFARKTYLGGTLTVLTEVGNPYPSGDAYNVYVARRGGNGTKSGAIIVLNNNDSQTKGVWISTSPSGWANWANQWLKNAFNPTERVQIQADGRVYVQAPARGYAIYVLDNEYVAYNTKSAKVEVQNDLNKTGQYDTGAFSLSVTPNPVNTNTTININLPVESASVVNLYNTNGQIVTTLYDGVLPAGKSTLQLAPFQLTPGIYICKAIVNDQVKIVKILVK